MSGLPIVVLILMVLAVVLLGLAAFLYPYGSYPNAPATATTRGPFNLGWAGLAAWALAELVAHIPPH